MEPVAANPVSQAIAAAAQAQARAIANGRSSQQSQPSGAAIAQGFAAIASGAAVEGGTGEAATFGALPPINEMKQADWAKLPPKLANDLLEGSREKVSPQYRQAIETYFRLLAEEGQQ